MHSGVRSPARDGFVHPRASTFRRPRVEIDVELSDRIAGAIGDFVEAHVGMPDRCLRGPDSQPVQLFNQPKHPRQHLGFREVLFHLLIRERIPFQPQLFGGVSEVPGLELLEPKRLAGEFSQLSKVALSIRTRTPSQLLEKILHLTR